LTQDEWGVEIHAAKGIDPGNRFGRGTHVKTIHAFLIAAAVALSVADSASANLIVNGDFSANASSFVGWPGYASWTSTFGGGTNPAISGWGTNGSFGIGLNGKDTFGNYPTPSPIVAFGPTDQQTTPTVNWAFLQGGGGAILQVINVTPNVEYTASFLAAGRPGNPAQGSAYVYDGTLGVNNLGLLPGGIFNKAYGVATFEPDSFKFTPTLSTATIVFQNAGGGDAVNFTNIAVVPEPSTLAGLAIGVVALGLAFRRK